MLIIPALIIMKLLHNGPLSGWEDIKLPGWEAIGLVIALAFALLPIVSFTGQINAVMHLPVWLSGVENWMIKKEESTDDLIDTLIFSNTIPGMVLNLVIIAMIPAIAEEFIFRGILQKILIRLFSSDHIAIFVTAIIFSAIHFQFFGFIPRFILGLVFGYLFLWGGTLWLPIVAHFVNNAFPVILTYFQESGRLSTTPDISLLKQAIALPFWIVICMVILLYFRNKKRSNGITSSPPTP
jgi:membrane protease YdiL (CAAX protease family)